MQIISVTPEQNAVNVSLTQAIEIIFDADIIVETVDNSSVVVSTKRKNVLTADINNIIRPEDGIFSSDLFFHENLTGIINGRVDVVDNKVIFVPLTRYSPNTQYEVLISNTIQDINNTSLDSIKSLTFITHEEDMVEPLPKYEEYATIIGKNINFDTSGIPHAEDFRVEETYPVNNTFLVSDPNIEIIFSDTPDSEALNYVDIYLYQILSDYPPVKINTDCTLSISGNKIVIVINPEIDFKNKVIKIILRKGLPSNDSNSLISNYILQFTGLLEPYFTSTKLIRLKAGTVLKAIPDDILALGIYYHSVQASGILSHIAIPDLNKLLVASQYALYKTIKMNLLNNFESGMNDFIAKQFTEFKISISNKSQFKYYNLLLDEIVKWESSFSNYITSNGTKNYIKYPIRDSEIGRLWTHGSFPGRNSKVPAGSYLKLDWKEIISPL